MGLRVFSCEVEDFEQQPHPIAIKGRNLEVENGDLAPAVQALKNQPGKGIMVLAAPILLVR